MTREKIATPMPVRRRTELRALLSVASKLDRNEYELAFTPRNAPVFDLVARRPGGTQFLIDTKGQQKEGMWWGAPKEPCTHLYYVYVLVASGSDAFHTMSQTEYNDLVYEHWNEPHRTQREPNGFSQRRLDRFKGGLHKLPDWREGVERKGDLAALIAQALVAGAIYEHEIEPIVWHVLTEAEVAEIAP